jgi:predicted phage-related endonuclease
MLRVMFDLDFQTVLSDSNLALVEELRSTREFIKKLKAREDEIRKILLVELKESEQGITAAGVPMIEVQRQSRTRVDGNRLQALYHEVWEDCQIETTVSVLRLPEAP